MHEVKVRVSNNLPTLGSTAPTDGATPNFPESARPAFALIQPPQANRIKDAHMAAPPARELDRILPHGCIPEVAEWIG
jgi:hypothetical protein